MRSLLISLALIAATGAHAEPVPTKIAYLSLIVSPSGAFAGGITYNGENSEQQCKVAKRLALEALRGTRFSFVCVPLSTFETQQ